MYRHRELLTSILASAMLTSTLFPAAEGGWHASAVDPAAVQRAMQAAFSGASNEGWQPVSQTFVASPAPVILTAATKASAATPQPLLSPEKLKAIIDLGMTGQKVYTVAQPMSLGLGLAHPFAAKNVGFDAENVRHGVAIGLPDGTRVIFFRKTAEGLQVFASDRLARLLSAGTFVNNVFTPVALDVARPVFEAELRLWEAEPLPEPAPVATAAMGTPGA